MATEHKQIEREKQSLLNKKGQEENGVNPIKYEEKKDVLIRYNVNEIQDRVKFEGIDDDDNDSILCSEEPAQEAIPPKPDGGYGWLVVAASFFIAACADGLAFSFSLLQGELTRYFESTQSKTSLIGSIFMAAPLLAGPFMSALVDRYGCRVMTMIAGIFSALGFILASICNTVEMLYLTFGLLSGLALGIVHVTAVVSVAFWFDKRKNFAVSLSSCGIGFGTLIFSPLTKYLIETYDWRNTVVLLAGILLNITVCGALMRDPDWLVHKRKKEKRERRMSKVSRKSSLTGSVSGKSVGGESLYFSPDELKELLKSGKSPEYILATLASTIAEAKQLEATTQMNADGSCKRINSVIHLPTFVQHNEKVPVEVIEKLMANKSVYNIIVQNYPELMPRRKSTFHPPIENETPKVGADPKLQSVTVTVQKQKGDNNSEKKKLEKTIELETKDNRKAKLNEVELVDLKPAIKKDTKSPRPARNWLTRQLSTDKHYLRDMPMYKNTIMLRGAMLNIPRYKLKAASLPDIYKNSMWSLVSAHDDERKWYHRFWAMLRNSFDFSMFGQLHFLMFNLSTVILSVWFVVPYFFINSFMASVNVEGGASIISIIGISSSVGIVALGWAGDQPWVNVTKAYALCLIICAASVASYPFFITNYWIVAVVSAIFGLSFASNYALTPSILIKSVSIERFTVAYGLILLTQGIGHLAGPPVGGLVYDLTGSWPVTFYIGGAWLLASGLCVCVIAFTDDRRLCGSPSKTNSNDANV